jgi:hypothetical protein
VNEGMCGICLYTYLPTIVEQRALVGRFYSGSLIHGYVAVSAMFCVLPSTRKVLVDS